MDEKTKRYGERWNNDEREKREKRKARRGTIGIANDYKKEVETNITQRNLAEYQKTQLKIAQCTTVS